jgi:hypothetical protein
MIKQLLIDNNGIEFEFPQTTESVLSNIARGHERIMDWRPEHDGSTQRPSMTIAINGGLRLPFKGAGHVRGIVQEDMCGAELVSPIINTETNEWIENIKIILDTFGNKYLGYLDPKCSFHVHVNMTGAPIYVLKNVINIWTGIEALVFRLSVADMGYHRGLKRRNFLYCRPIASPQVIVDQDKSLRPSYDYMALLEARTLKEFFQASNNTSIAKDPSKYNPVRYNALNFFNFIKYGTVEFRTFNLTYNWRYVVAWVNLCKAICRSAFGKEYEYEKMLLGSHPENFDMETLRVMLGLDDWTMTILYELYYMNDWVEFDTPSWQFTHLPENKRTNWSQIPKRLQPPVIDGQDVRYYPDKYNDAYGIIRSGYDLEKNINFVEDNNV